MQEHKAKRITLEQLKVEMTGNEFFSIKENKDFIEITEIKTHHNIEINKENIITIYLYSGIIDRKRVSITFNHYGGFYIDLDKPFIQVAL